MTKPGTSRSPLVVGSGDSRGLSPNSPLGPPRASHEPSPARELLRWFSRRCGRHEGSTTTSLRSAGVRTPKHDLACPRDRSRPCLEHRWHRVRRTGTGYLAARRLPGESLLSGRSGDARRGSSRANRVRQSRRLASRAVFVLCASSLLRWTCTASSQCGGVRIQRAQPVALPWVLPRSTQPVFLFRPRSHA